MGAEVSVVPFIFPYTLVKVGKNGVILAGNEPFKVLGKLSHIYWKCGMIQQTAYIPKQWSSSVNL